MSDFASYRAKRLAMQDRSACRAGGRLDVLSDLELEVIFEISGLARRSAGS